VDREQQHLIVTAQPEFAQAALIELQRLDPQLTRVEELAPGVLLCSAANAPHLIHRIQLERPIFVRHLAPVQTAVPLTHTEQDLGTIATAIAQLPTLALLERGTRFAIQTRFVQTSKQQGERPYSGGQLNQTLAQAFAEETGAVEDIKKPRIAVSLLCTQQTCYIGISPVEENLSSWPGGARHFAHVPEQISRAEFKLLEGLEAFGVTLPEQGRALDLGAAPGGWTRLLLDAGLQVVAVDPANLDPRLEKRTRLEHYRGYAENYLDEALQKRYRFDLIANDMRMDAREAARLLAKAAVCLHSEGFMLSVFKLPHHAPGVDPLINLREALDILRTRYGIVQARQLFHNRQEVTVVAGRPLLVRSEKPFRR
jgi:23S rRNA (cytidine2498-2'-O)-methyltransferase